MKTDTLRVGIDDPKFYVTVNIKVPENDADVATLATAESYRVQCFVRGDRINQQEGDAREDVRDMVTGKASVLLAKLETITDLKTRAQAETFQKEVTAKVQATVDAFDRTAEKKRGGRTAKVVKLDETTLRKLMKDPKALAAYLAAQGLKVELVTE